MSPRERLFAVTSPTAVSREATLKPVMAVPNKPIRSTTEAIACAEVPLGDSAPQRYRASTTGSSTTIPAVFRSV